ARLRAGGVPILSRVKPLIAITSDLIVVNGVERVVAGRGYAAAIARAGGMPVVVPPDIDSVPELLSRFDGFIFTGGDDPVTEPFGEPTHPSAIRVHPLRQAFECALLAALTRSAPDKPVLGVCLGMQMMALVAGGSLDQHLPETTPTHAQHWEADHDVIDVNGCGMNGTIRSKHRQAVRDPGSLAVACRAHDGVIEAIADAARRYYVGVQWHPERPTSGSGPEVAAVGDGLFRQLVNACGDDD
ncbi:MAG: gamma-glutamyl-gamma-aminobutyrate hydrolase family protein, partial [Planctomycetota bacterium]